MNTFFDELKKHRQSSENRRWIYVPYDQLSDEMGPLSREDPNTLGIILIENRLKPKRRPYHVQKLALLLTNMRHFAIEQAKRGVAIRYECVARPYGEVLADLSKSFGPISFMTPAEHELRIELQPGIAAKNFLEIPHEGWLTSTQQFEKACPKKPWRMDRFYAFVREQTGFLMKNGKPLGGKFSHDADNRKPWKGSPKSPTPPTFKPDAITQEVARLVRKHFSHHPGTLTLENLPATDDDAQTLWDWAKENCLPHFGPYEDAMSILSTGIFHTRLSALTNLHRLLPKNILKDVLGMKISLPSQEGFVRQILGWREFMHHIHVQTNGFRDLKEFPVRHRPTDAGYSRWKNPSASDENTLVDSPFIDGGVNPNQGISLPAAYWGTPSGLFCLDHVVKNVWAEGYSHHITRLMVLANIATLLEVNARDLTDWFWVAYTDAFDWVVEPNVLGMGTFSLGELFTTKPYISGAGYIDRMSDFCSSCAFDPKKNCPLTRLYWSYLQRHEDRLAKNMRLKMPLASLKKRSTEEKVKDQRTFEQVQATLSRGESLTPGIPTLGL